MAHGLHAELDRHRQVADLVLAEALLIALVYVVGVTLVWRNYVALSTTATWYAAPTDGGMMLSLTYSAPWITMPRASA